MLGRRKHLELKQLKPLVTSSTPETGFSSSRSTLAAWYASNEDGGPLGYKVVSYGVVWGWVAAVNALFMVSPEVKVSFGVCCWAELANVSLSHFCTPASH